MNCHFTSFQLEGKTHRKVGRWKSTQMWGRWTHMLGPLARMGGLEREQPPGQPHILFGSKVRHRQGVQRL